MRSRQKRTCEGEPEEATLSEPDLRSGTAVAIKIVRALSTFQKWKGLDRNQAPARETEEAKQAEVDEVTRMAEEFRNVTAETNRACLQRRV